jgi:ABC-2 type transport system ATP-binding protein
MSKPIETCGLAKRFRSGFLIREIRALESVTLEVHAGEIFGFLGPNGAGKTTTIKILMGLTRATGGTATVLGELPSSAGVKRRIGFLPEQPYFYDYLSAREVLELNGRLCGITGKALKQRVDEMLALVGLTQAQRSRLGRFSRGMLQRVGVAQALLHDPELVILDEPMGGLDPVGRKEFRDIILGLHERGKTVFFSTHILQDVEMVCDRVGIIVGGRMVSAGRLDEIVATRLDAVELTVRGLSSAALQSAGIAGLRVLESEGKLLVTVASEDAAEQVLKAVTAQGARLEAMVPQTHTLEDYFMDQVRKEAQCRAAGPEPR